MILVVSMNQRCCCVALSVFFSLFHLSAFFFMTGGFVDEVELDDEPFVAAQEPEIPLHVSEGQFLHLLHLSLCARSWGGEFSQIDHISS